MPRHCEAYMVTTVLAAIKYFPRPAKLFFAVQATQFLRYANEACNQPIRVGLIVDNDFSEIASRVSVGAAELKDSSKPCANWKGKTTKNSI
jgi:hypothetical protein